MTFSLAGLEIRQNELLKPYTTFKIGGPARYFAEVRAPEHLDQAMAFARAERVEVFVLGGGSNVLISDRGFDGLVLHPVRAGIETVRKTSDGVSIRVNAAETWDAVVACAVERGWWGIENLSHIPGQAGAAIVQNIGAYGQEISRVFESAQVAELGTGRVRTFDAADCRFAYRTSIFNSARKGQLFIFSITLRLATYGEPDLGYPDVKRWFEARSVARPTLREVRQAIIAIRDRKFPFPREEKGGNVGSFFKNLLLTSSEYATLEQHFARNFPADDLARLRALRSKFPTPDRVKIPTAFLMEVCGLKELRIGGAQVNRGQPLVLLNQGGATARDVLALAREVRQAIYAMTGVTVMIEPELVGFTPEELEQYLELDPKSP